MGEKLLPCPFCGCADILPSGGNGSYDETFFCVDCGVMTADWNVRADLTDDLRTALHDAIRRPMGVIPTSAESFVSTSELDRAEARRSGKD